MANNNTDIELLAGLEINSSEAEILKAIKIIEKRLKANHDARIKLNADIDDTVIKSTIEKLQNLLKNVDLKVETQSSIEAITKEANSMLDVVDSAKKASKEKLEFAKANEKVERSADNTANAVTRERNAMDSLDDVDDILSNINMYGRQGNSVFNQLGNSFRDAFAAYSLANLMERALDGVVEAGKEAVETVKSFDDINVDLQLATGEDKGYVKQLISDYSELGEELGVLTGSVAESANIFLRQGRSIEDTNQLIRDSIVLSKIAKTSSEKSAEILTATINGFQMAANEGSKVSDVLSSIDLHSASDASGIGDALTKVASMANNTGLSLEKTAAMLATIKDVTQDADTVIGTSLKTVLSRMSSIKAGKFVDEESGEALNDVERVLGKINVSMRYANGQFKESEIILDEIGTKWKTLDKNTQNAIKGVVGGVYQSNKVAALFDNYDKVLELTKVAENSSGQALSKFNESYIPSLEAKTQALKNSLEQLATTTISDDLYESVLDVSKGIVDLTADTGLLKTTLVALGTAGGTFAFTQLTGFLSESVQGLSNFSSALNLVKAGTIDMQMLVDLTHGLSNSQMRLLLSTNQLTDSQKIALMVANGTQQELAEQQLQTWGLIGAQRTATVSTVTLGSAMKGMMATMVANPIFLVTTAVTLGISAFNAYQSAVEKAEKKIDDLRTTLQETTSELDNVNSEIESINKQMDELLAKDTITLTDENDLKRLQLGNDELERRRVLLEAQKLEDTDALNEEIEKRYAKEYTQDEDIHFGNDTVTKEEYISRLIGRYNELLGLQRKMTDEEKTEAEEIRNAMVEEGNYLVQLTDGYVAVTEEQREIKSGWEQMIAETARVAETYPGTVMDITRRLSEKFANGVMWGDEATFVSASGIDKQIASWINTLSEDEKKILLKCELDNASLDDLKAYLAEQTADIEVSADVKYSFSYDKLGDISQKLSEVENAYKTAQEAMDSYNEHGYYSMSVIDSILSLEDEYINILVDEDGQLQINSASMNKLASVKIEAAKASIYQETCEELVRIKTLDTALAAQELAVINGTLTKSEYETVQALYEEVKAMGGANAVLAGEVWESASKKVKLLDNQLKSLSNGSYDVGRSALVKEAEQAIKDYLNSYMNYMKASLESGIIDYKAYSRDVSALLEDMYAKGKIAAKDYHDYSKQMLEVQKSAMDSAIGAVTYRLNLQLETYKDQQDQITERYESEIEYLDTVIKYYEDQKKALQDNNDEIDRQLALEQALYNFERSQNQRTQLIFTANKGMVYQVDDSAIRESGEDVRKAKLDIELAKLDEAIAKIELQQETLQQSMDREKAQLQEIIDNLSDYRDKWANVSKEWENQQNDLLAKQILGADYENQILNGRIDVLDSFQKNYIAIQQAIADAAWASANAQIEAAQEAAKGVNGVTGSAQQIATYETSENYKIVDSETGTTINASDYGDASQKLASLNAFEPDQGRYYIKKYATGTENAKRGLNLVGEEGTETFIDNDGNASLVTKPTLIPMEGGETVKNASETKSLLNEDNLVPIQDILSGKVPLTLKKPDDILLTKPQETVFMKALMNNSAVIQPNMNIPDYSHLNNLPIRNNAQTFSIGEVNVTCPGITSNDVAKQIGSALQKEFAGLSLKANQQMSRTR